MKKSLLWLVGILIVSIVVTLSFGGCKKGTAAETTSAAVTAAETTTAATTATANTTAEPKKIVWWTLWTEPEAQAGVIKGWVNDYKKIHPEITVDVVYAGRELMTKVMAARQGGTTIDIIDWESFTLKGSLVNEGQTLVMDQYLNAPRFEGDIPWKDNFIPGSLQQYAANDGSVSIINHTIMTVGFFYDKKLWKDNGWIVPKTWDEFLKLCDTIKNTSKIPPLTQDGQIDFYNAMWNYEILEKLKGPGALLAAVKDKTGASWDDPAFKKAAEMELDLIKKGYFIDGWDGFTYPNGQAKLASREAAMELNGTWLANELAKQIESDWEWGFFPMPEIAGGVGKITDLESYPLGWIIFKDSKVGPEAAEFLKFCTSVANAQKYADGANSISAVKEANAPKALADVGGAFKNATTLFNPYDGIPAFDPDYYKNIYLKNHNLLFTGKATPDQFIQSMKQDTINYWKSKG